MGKISNLAEPKKVEIEKYVMNATERFLWWKKQYMLTFSIMISCLIIPMFAYRRGIVNWGIKLSIIFYALLMIIHYMINKVTKDADNKFLESKGYITKKKTRWWMYILKGIFMVLRIYIIYLMISTWVKL